MSPDQELTIILTLKDRPAFTFRWMAYANTIKLPFKILLADGGADETVPTALARKANYPNLNFEYIRYPYDQTFVEYYDKVADALARVETPLVALADNDDFSVVSGLVQSVDFLSQHKDYSTCRGNIGTCVIHPNENGSVETYGAKVTFTPQPYPNESIDQDTALGRLQGHFSFYEPSWYDVHRTEQLREWFHTLKELGLRDFYLAELLISCFAVIAGKIKRGDFFYLLRQSFTPDSEGTRKSGVLDRMLLESWSAEFKKFVDSLAAALAARDHIAVDEAREHVKELYRGYIAPHLIRSLSPGRPGKLRALVSELRLFGPVKKGVRRLMKSGTKLNGGPLGAGALAKSSPYYDELKPIQEFLAAGPAGAPVFPGQTGG